MRRPQVAAAGRRNQAPDAGKLNPAVGTAPTAYATRRSL